MKILAVRVFILGLLLSAVCGLAGASDDWTTSAPITYCIDYGDGHVGNPAYLKTVAEAPPDLLHVGEDVPFSSVYGTKDGYAGNKFKLLSPEELRAKIAAVTEYVASLHRAGVRWVIPYINNKAVIADHVKRTGLWEFFDHWDQYAEFGFGPRPAEDLVLAQMDYPFRPIRLLKPTDNVLPNKLYQMCGNHPTWRQYLLAVTANIAKCGYDGTFVDEMDMRDYCPYDEAKFREYVMARYDSAERRRRYGTADANALRLGYPGEGTLWHDTQEFWSQSNADLLAALRDEGRKYRADFFVVPNLGPFAHFDGVRRRISSGKDPGPWARTSRIIMFEEWHRPGQFGDKVFLDYRLQYKLAFSLGFRGGLLSYMAEEPVGIELSMAEGAAGGGGALIQPYYHAPESRRKYGSFFKEHTDLLEGYDSQADVGILFSYEQLYWGNTTHLQDVYRLSEYLSNQHVTYDLVDPAQATAHRLSRYKVVITPSLLYLADATLRALETYARNGGVWLNVGNSGRYDDAGGLRPDRAQTGRIVRVDELNDVLAYPRFAPYLLDEDQSDSLEETKLVLDRTLAGEHPVRVRKPKQDLRALLEQQTGRNLSVLTGSGLEGLRCNLWRKKGPNGETLTAHFVNYYCLIPLAVKMGPAKGEFHVEEPPERLAPRMLEGVSVRLDVPADRVKSIRAFDPDLPGPVALQHQRTPSGIEFVLPAVRIYKLVEIDLK
ncbi:MAG: beta-galactosidase trimerization domain-containing protein [Terriglobia bacterium]|jgi:hypothetical protein